MNDKNLNINLYDTFTSLSSQIETNEDSITSSKVSCSSISPNHSPRTESFISYAENSLSTLHHQEDTSSLSLDSLFTAVANDSIFEETPAVPDYVKNTKDQIKYFIKEPNATSFHEIVSNEIDTANTDYQKMMVTNPFHQNDYSYLCPRMDDLSSIPMIYQRQINEWWNAPSINNVWPDMIQTPYMNKISDTDTIVETNYEKHIKPQIVTTNNLFYDDTNDQRIHEQAEKIYFFDDLMDITVHQDRVYNKDKNQLEYETNKLLRSIPLQNINNIDIYRDTDPTIIHFKDSTPVTKSNRKKYEKRIRSQKCTCQKSKCLKLYCDCLAAGGFCNENCICLDCGNRMDAEKNELEEREKMIKRQKKKKQRKMNGLENKENNSMVMMHESTG